MSRNSTSHLAAAIIALMVIGETQSADATAQSTQAPIYEVDPAWPKPLPNRWILGAVVGVAVDARGHVWITHRPSTLQPNETRSIWRAAPPVVAFDRDGTLVTAWGGPGAGYEWPDLEHGIHVDEQDNVWVGGGGEKDAHILKFTRDGKFLLQIGRKGQGKGSNDTQNLGGAAHMIVDRAANELYVADGYVNHRVIVFDATTGAYKRHWGAYGKPPDDSYFHTAGESFRVRSRGSCSTRTVPATTIRTVRLRLSSASFTQFASRTMAWSTSAIAPTIAFKCFAKTARS